MPQYFIAIYLPDDFDPSTQTEETIEEILTFRNSRRRNSVNYLSSFPAETRAWRRRAGSGPDAGGR